MFPSFGERRVSVRCVREFPVIGLLQTAHALEKTVVSFDKYLHCGMTFVIEIFHYEKTGPASEFRYFWQLVQKENILFSELL
jgi:hypothetical protein